MTIFLLACVIAIAGLAIILLLPPLRRLVLTRPIFAVFRRVLPDMSDTERDALEAGTVWWDGALFRGRPDWKTLLAYPPPRLTEREQLFFDNEVTQLCRLVDDWDVTQNLFDLPRAAWDEIKRKGFLGMIIPEQYGGLGFSAYAHSTVITRLSTRCSALAVSVMVPNSLGPAELLLHYGTDEQKAYYLPRLAAGQEIPAFALTSPWAGSDAAAIPDRGVVCKGQWNGQEVIGMRVTWDKRYITLAPVCTLLGLAFRLEDPDGLLGGRRDIGITCALVPHNHPGVSTGRRHFPLNAMFMNGPTRGTDVFMPLDFIIGGVPMAGHGWRMLMECLAAGRAISLPSSNAGMSQLTARAVGAYARVRTQFGLPVGKFEGVEEALGRIGGHTYLIEAARSMTAAAIDLGEKPSVVSTIVKYHVTEQARQVVNDGMDVIGGKGICLGPSNFLGRAYQQIPIGITVEGANILTRSLMLFGQGAIRCHPYVLDEMRAAHHPDARAGLLDFERVFWRHVRFVMGNGVRTVWTALTAGRTIAVDADVAPQTAGYYRQLSRLSVAFAWSADIAMLSLGGDLKRRERISARLGDVLSQLYLASAALKRFETQGRPEDDLPLVHWSVQYAIHQAYQAFAGVIANYPNRAVAAVLRATVLPFGVPSRPPADELEHEIAHLLMMPGAARDRLTADCYIPANAHEPVGVIEQALHATLRAEPVDAKIRQFEKSGKLDGHPLNNIRDRTAAAYALGAITSAEHAIAAERDVLRDRVIAVDDFPFDYGGARNAPSAVEHATSEQRSCN